MSFGKAVLDLRTPRLQSSGAVSNEFNYVVQRNARYLNEMMSNYLLERYIHRVPAISAAGTGNIPAVIMTSILMHGVM